MDSCTFDSELLNSILHDHLLPLHSIALMKRLAIDLRNCAFLKR